jgi:hypothetical protein
MAHKFSDEDLKQWLRSLVARAELDNAIELCREAEQALSEPEQAHGRAGGDL